jgi:excisionase family DNA binding protein
VSRPKDERPAWGDADRSEAQPAKANALEHSAATAEERKRQIGDALRALERIEHDIAWVRPVLAELLREERPDEIALEWLTVEQAAALMHVSARTVRREILDARLPARGRRRSVLVRRSDVVQWLEARPTRPVRAIADDASPDLERRVRARLRGIDGGAR